MNSSATAQNSPVPSTTFDRSTAIERSEEDLFTAEITPEWHAFRGPNGGYLAALLLSAMLERSADAARQPRSLSAHYLKVPSAGPAQIRTRVLRVGRSMTWLAAELSQEGGVCVDARAALSVPWQGIDYGPTGAPTQLSLDPESGLPGVDGMPRFTRQFHYRSLFGSPARRDPQGRVGGFIRPREPRPYDAAMLTTLTDAWFPSTFAHDARFAMAATLDLTVHFRDHAAAQAQPHDAFIFSSFRSRLSAEGFFEEDGELWSAEGRLLAQSRQLAIAAPLGGAR